VLHDGFQVLEASVVVEAALRLGEEALERGGHVRVARRAVGVEVVGADLLAAVRVPACVGEERRHVAACALPFAVEDLFATPCGTRVEGALRRSWRRQRKLVEVERGELRGHAVFLAGSAQRPHDVSYGLTAADVPAPAPSCDWVLGGVVEAWVVEVADPHHLGVRDVGVPIAHGPPAGTPGVEVVTGQAEGRRNPDGPKVRRRAHLPVVIDDRVEVSGPPALQNALERCLVDLEQVGEGRQVGRARDDLADVEILVWPAVEAVADAGRQRVVDRGVAEGTRQPERAKRAVVEEALGSEDGVEPQQRRCDRRVVEVDLASAQRLHNVARQGIHVHLEAKTEHLPRTQRPYRLVEAQLTAPERFVAEGVESEDLLSLGEQLVARGEVLRVGTWSVEGPDRADDRDSQRVQDEAAHEKGRRGEKQSLHTAHAFTDRRSVWRGAP
jgi:hypothetical protein